MVMHDSCELWLITAMRDDDGSLDDEEMQRRRRRRMTLHGSS
jgi:hypothetical protein